MRLFFQGLAGVLAAGIAVAAQAAPKLLTLQDCVRLAQAAQSSVVGARQEAEIADLSLSRARAAFLPKIQIDNNTTFNSSRRNSPGEFSFVALNGVREFSTQLTTIEELDISGRLRAQRDRARADQDTAEANLVLALRNLRQSVSAAYFRVLLARHLVEVTQDALDEGQSFEKRTRLLFTQGEAAEADVFKASAQVAVLEQALNKAELESEIANHDLASFWTAEVEATVPLEDVLERPAPAPDPSELARADGKPFLRRAEFSLLNSRRRGFLADARRNRADLLPQASVVFQYGIDAQHYRIGERGFAAFVNLNIPVFDWFRAHNASEQFKMKAQQLTVQHQVANRIFSKEYRDALSRVRRIYRQISLAQREVTMSEKSLRLSRIRYDGGEGFALDVIAAQQGLTQARTDYYSALADYLNARVALEVATGK